MSKRYWRIRGEKKSDTIFDVTIPSGSITDEQLKELLKCLAATTGRLSCGEIIGAYVKRKTKLANEVLGVKSMGPYLGYWCGTEPSFTAILVDEKGERIECPALPWA